MSHPTPWTPRDYQLEALEFALGRTGCGLMLDPGLGKTSTSLAYTSIRLENGDISRALVVAPLRVAKTVWPIEARKWSDFNHLRVKHLCEMSEDERTFHLKRDYHIFVINAESLVKVLAILKRLGSDYWPELLIVDESTKFKDTSTQRFKALKNHLLDFKYRIILTGTPAPNGVADLFGQIYLVDLGKRLGRYITHFRQRFMMPDYTGYNYTLIPGAEKQIYALINDVLLRQKAAQHLAMPELLNNFIEIELPPGARKHYKEVERDFLTRLANETVVAFNAAAAGSKCRQISNGFVYSSEVQGQWTLLHEEKLDALEELVEEMQGRPLLVLYEFVADKEMIKARFSQAVDINDGKVEENIRRFNEGSIPLLVAHPASAGHGLNLQESCSTVCWYGVTWNLEHYQQAIARVWRQGQKSDKVIVHHIVAKDTLDQRVLKTLAAKDAVQERLSEALIAYAKQTA